MCDSLYLHKGNTPAIFMRAGSSTALNQPGKAKQISVGTHSRSSRAIRTYITSSHFQAVPGAQLYTGRNNSARSANTVPPDTMSSGLNHLFFDQHNQNMNHFNEFPEYDRHNQKCGTRISTSAEPAILPPSLPVSVMTFIPARQLPIALITLPELPGGGDPAAHRQRDPRTDVREKTYS